MHKLKKWRKKYEVTQYQLDALRQLKPPEDISVSEWAEKYRILDSKTTPIPGPWRNSRTPYLMEIMDELRNYETRETVFCKCTQIGGTEVELNMTGYVIQQDPTSMMIVYPTDTLGLSVSENRIQEMIRLSPTLKKLYREYQSKNLELQFDGMYLTIAGSNSPASLASKAVKYLFLDEVDKYPAATKKEADPISLARERTKNYPTRKIYITSTPTLREGHIWKALQGCDIEKHYFVPCPHCGEMIELKFRQIKFPDAQEGMTVSDRADQAVYVCQECGCIITDGHKEKMLRYGEWRIVRDSNTAHRKVGYWINVLYSPFVRFSEVASEWLDAQGDQEKLQNFINSWLAEPWEDTKLKTSAELVMERKTEVPEFTVPDWAKMLTAGVDVQESCLYWSIHAWGDYITSQNICHGQALSWTDIERVMNLPYYTESGEQMIVSLCLVDSGYNADDTYEFCVSNSEWALPVKGSSNPMMSHYKISVVNRPDSKAHGMNLVIVDGGKYKDMIAARMKKENGRGSWMVHRGCDMEYAEQVTSEHKVSVRMGNGKTRLEWKQKSSHADNHYLDCAVYAMAAADILGVRSLYLEDAGAADKKPKETEKPEHDNSEMDWIKTNEDWMGGENWLKQ